MTAFMFKNDPDEMKIAREASFLCEIFQKHKLNADEKKMIIRELIQDFKKKKEEEDGQSNQEGKKIH